MEVLHKPTENKNLILALGYFDGIHIGHRKIITTLVREAKLQNTKSAVITFQKNPADYFNAKATPAIQTYKDKEILLEALGVNYLYELDFENYKNLSAEEYLRDVLIKYFKPKAIVVGYNHTFGRKKGGSAAFLKEMAKEYDFKCIIIPQQKYKDKEEVSSTEIRKKIRYGQLNAITSLLGRHFSIRNSVIQGDKLATTLGYPTANLIWPESMAKLPYGVYCGFAHVDKKVYPALISWGTKPTLTNGQNEILESHIYNFHQNLYGKIIKILFIKKIRNEENFGNINILKAQLKKDYKVFEDWINSIKQS